MIGQRVATFGDAFEQLGTFEGRGSRSEFFLSMLMIVAGLFVLRTILYVLLEGEQMIVDEVIDTFSVANGFESPGSRRWLVDLGSLLVTLVAWYFSLAAIVRRLHDLGWSGWVSIALCIPVIGKILFLVLLFVSSSQKVNRWGGVPYLDEPTGWRNV